MIKKPLRIHEKSLSNVLAPSKKKLPAALASGGSADTFTKYLPAPVQV